ncbi:nucleotidyltransferase domain-containing protein [Clostridium oceanicum]|uniref:Nucleotidyltransferase domain-containing protein n=1 Tax=Clostridium oceanicum TaxID=1543 RepID=A0ABP3V3R7_9CLOT
MDNSIVKYQKAYSKIINRLKSNEDVLATMVFGSMVTGDLWKESDIDLFVIIDEIMDSMKNVYTEDEEKVPVHVKVMSKKELKRICEEELRGGKMHRIFSSSRLVFSKDKQITAWYDGCRYYPDMDKERWNLVYLGNVFKNAGVCKKYLKSKTIYTAYSACISTLEEFSKLCINYSGYMISKDVITMSTNLDDDLKKIVDELFLEKEDLYGAINNLLDYIGRYINKNISNICNVLISYLKEKDKLLSSEEILEDDFFSSYNINMEEILKCLSEKNIIKRDSRKLNTDNGKWIFKENVYFV